MAWGPCHRDAAILVTFDNFGEAFERQQGRWSKENGLGTHYTAHETLPELIEILDQTSIKTTYFVEGCNASLYPDQLKTFVNAGHEVGVHGWQHEHWAHQTDEQRMKILTDAVHAFKEIGIIPKGFRPPGGKVTPNTYDLMTNLGLRYLSSIGEAISITEGVAELPFRWCDVDALYFEPWLGEAREETLGSPELMTIKDWSVMLDRTYEKTLSQKDCAVLIFHPYLLGKEGRMETFERFIKKMSADDRIWSPRMDELCAWVGC